MAENGGDARSKRAQSRGERREKSASAQKEQGQGQEQDQHDEVSSDQGDGNGGGQGFSTPKLVAAGAAAGALLGTAKAVLDRRQAHGGIAEEQNEHEDYEDHDDDGEREQESRGRSGERQQASSDQPAGVRGLLVTVLEAALDAVQEPGQQARQEHDGGDDERRREEEDDDDEAEREPRAEQIDEGRPAARGESGEAGRAAAPGDGDEGPDAETAGGRPQAVGEADEPVSRGRHDDEEDEERDEDDEDEDDERGEARVGERPLDEGARPIATRNGNGDGDPAEVLARARKQIAALVGREPESTSRVEHVDGGWRLAFEVVEVPRIPPTTDVMASYSVAVDESGNVLEFGRTQRYSRNRAEGEA